MAVKPFSPAEAKAAQVTLIPDEVIEAVNELLAMEAGTGSSCTLRQKDILALALKKFKEHGQNYTVQTVYNNHWMDFENAFRKEGWKVDYDKPGYNESYEPTFHFSVPR